LSQSPCNSEANITAQKLAKEILLAGDIIDRIFFYQDACYTALQAQVPGQGLQSSYDVWLQLAQEYDLPLQSCIANSLRRGIIDQQEAERYQVNENIHSSFELVGLGELAQACLSSDRIIKL
jgi:tRNA 2-thiouridine synthesizing protein D